MTFYEVLISSVLLWFIVKDAINHRRTDTLLNRIMSKNYEEFKYYEEKYPEDLKELKTIRKEAHKDSEKVKATLFEDDQGNEINLQQWEEDWAESELDVSKLMKKDE